VFMTVVLLFRFFMQERNATMHSERKISELGINGKKKWF